MDSPDGWSYATRWQSQYDPVARLPFASIVQPDSPVPTVVYFNPSDDDEPNPHQYTPQRAAPQRAAPAMPTTSPSRPPSLPGWPTTRVAPPGWTYGTKPTATPVNAAREDFAAREPFAGEAPHSSVPEAPAVAAARHPAESQIPPSKPPSRHSAQGKWEHATNARRPQPSTPFQPAASWENRASSEAAWRPPTSPPPSAWEEYNTTEASSEQPHRPSAARPPEDASQKAAKESKAEALRQRLAAASARRAETLRARSSCGKQRRQKNNASSTPSTEQQQKSQAQFAEWEKQARQQQGERHQPSSNARSRRVPPSATPPRSRASGSKAGGSKARSSSSAKRRPRCNLRAAAEDDAKWDKFVSRCDSHQIANDATKLRAVQLADVPFPKEVQVGEARWKVLARRWHPDKFGQRFGQQLSSADNEKIMDKVKQIFQRLSGARSEN